MPFDGRESNPIVQGIDRIEALFDGGARWCQGAFNGPDNRHCLIGALYVIEPNSRARYRLERCLRLAVPERFCWHVIAFNDHPKTTFEDITLVLHKAREIARGMSEIEPQNPVIGMIDDVEAFFGNGEKWLQGQSMDACGRVCLSQALSNEYGRYRDTAPQWFAIRACVENAIREIYGQPHSIIQFNDGIAGTYADVRRVLHRARELAIGDGHAV